MLLYKPVGLEYPERLYETYSWWRSQTHHTDYPASSRIMRLVNLQYRRFPDPQIGDKACLQMISACWVCPLRGHTSEILLLILLVSDLPFQSFLASLLVREMTGVEGCVESAASGLVAVSTPSSSLKGESESYLPRDHSDWKSGSYITSRW